MKYKMQCFQPSHFGCRNYFLSLCEARGIAEWKGNISISFISIFVSQ